MKALPIRNPFPGAVSLLEASLGSTMDEARRLAGAFFPPGSVIAAEEQTRGRGRFPERRWESPAGLNLLFTVRLGPEAFRPGSDLPLPGLPLRIGAALCSACDRYGRLSGAAFPRPSRLKWPNDLMLGDKKAAGVLCESGPLGVLAGVGLDCNQRYFSPALEGRATSLALELGLEIDRWELLGIFLEELRSALAGPSTSAVTGSAVTGPTAEPVTAEPAWKSRVEALLWRRGERAAFSPGLEASAAGGRAGTLTGRIAGVDAEGSLLFLVDGEFAARAFASGELELRR